MLQRKCPNDLLSQSHRLTNKMRQSVLLTATKCENSVLSRFPNVISIILFHNSATSKCEVISLSMTDGTFNIKL